MSSLRLSQEQRDHLSLLQRPGSDVVELCKSAFDYLLNGPNPDRYEALSKKYSDSASAETVQQTVEALISLLISVTTRVESSSVNMQALLRQTFPDLSDEVLEILEQFVTSKRNFVEGSIKSANIRAYRLVNLDWRLEVRTASRSLLDQCQVFVTMKLYLHTEPKNENRELLAVDVSGRSEQELQAMQEDERLHRKDMIVQTDVSSLLYMIKTLEDALAESKTRRIRNIVGGTH
ncbi:LOW QUALITY PROTEIN: COMM domain-containing protein 2 [Drosophila eugracilis]|uniref:LOW QUALITY PROTEIN: COMM domain-containing protein 2 n=1 Tax=Drosophila eugracilis TaxID=29029 RepID=UPI0007E5D438|nr:LOW QUALITY PROTEIN: COMM domain-containing protein 2 [Drosophila eugracilis]